MHQNLQTYTLSDIHLGMEIINIQQLSNIYDTWIILVKTKETDNYRIGFIGKETNAESDKLYTKDNIICPIYNDSIIFEE